MIDSPFDTDYEFLKKLELDLFLDEFNGLKVGYYCFYESEIYEIMQIHQLKGVTIRKRGAFSGSILIQDPFHLTPADSLNILYGPAPDPGLLELALCQRYYAKQY